MSALFLINSKRTSKASIDKYADMESPWRTPFSNLNYGVVMIVDHLITLLSNK